MGKKNYMRPFMSMELFRPNEYCEGTCGETGESKLVATCGDDGTHQHQILFTIDAGGNISGNGGDITDESGASNGHLYKNQRGEWVYMGTLIQGHHSTYYPNTGGEFYPTTDPSKLWTVEPASGENKVVYCDCILSSPGAHHHLHEIKVYINMS